MTLEQSLAEFLTHLGLERHASHQTVKSYREDLTQALAFIRDLLHTTSTAPGDWNARNLRGYIAWLTDQKYARSTVARRLAAVRSFGKFLCRIGLLKTNPAQALRSPRQDKRLPHFLTVDDIARLLSAPAPELPLGRRDRAILETLYSAGLRVSELVGLNLEDVDLGEGVLLVRGKGKKERLAILGEQAVAALQVWLADRSEVVNAALRSNPEAVFLNKNGGRLTSRSVARLLAKYLARAGLDPRTTPHTLRHSFASHMLDNGADIRGVQELLGHKSLTTTQVYTHISTQRMKKSYQAAHPRA